MKIHTQKQNKAALTIIEMLMDHLATADAPNKLDADCDMDRKMLEYLADIVQEYETKEFGQK